MNRRTFFRRTAGALATAAIAPQLQLSRGLPDDVWCKRCGCMQLPNHISASGVEYHTAQGDVYCQVAFTGGGTDHITVVPWSGPPPRRRR